MVLIKYKEQILENIFIPKLPRQIEKDKLKE